MSKTKEHYHEDLERMARVNEHLSMEDYIKIQEYLKDLIIILEKHLILDIIIG